MLYEVITGFTYPASCYLPRCASAFVGADITTALLASGMLERDQTALLVDIGTNGEMALWHDNRLYCCATAAGPAFEGAEISCGCQGVRGAIDQVWPEDNTLSVHTIGGRITSYNVCYTKLLRFLQYGLPSLCVISQLPSGPKVAAMSSRG